MNFDYKEHFTRLTDYELIEIIEQPEKVVPEATIAAKRELEKRNLPPEIIKKIQTVIESKNQKKIAFREKVNQTKARIEKEVTELVIVNEKPSQQRTIKLIAVGLGVLAVLKLIGSYKLIYSSMRASTKFIYLVPGIWLIAAFLFLLFKKRTGWFLSVGFFVFEIAFNYSGLFYWGLDYFSIHLIVYTLILLSPLFFLLKKELRNSFKIYDENIFFTFLISAILAVIYFIYILSN